jgi:hypothetical protein
MTTTTKVEIGVVEIERNEDENYVQIAFAEDRDDPGQYVILQRAIEPDEQDVELEQAGCYVEVFDESNSGYDICRKIVWDGTVLRLTFDDDIVELHLGKAKYSRKELVKKLTFVAKEVFEDQSTG